ncbi:hypothetical protein AgCh_027844 [Apium graveolens]
MFNLLQCIQVILSHHLHKLVMLSADSDGQGVATSGYSVARASGYAPLPYDAPPLTQSGYGQSSLAYNSSYKNAYPHPAAYSTDTNAAPTS